MAREHKANLVSDFAQRLNKKSAIFFDYHGIGVADFAEIKQQCHKHGSAIQVLKNTLIKRALDKNNLTVDDNVLKGMTATVLAAEESFGVSGKVLVVAEKAKQVVIKGGIYEDKSISADDVRHYATLPTKEELYGMLVGALEGVFNNLVVVLAQVKEAKAEGTTATASTEETKTSISDDNKPASSSQATQEVAPKPEPAEINAEDNKSKEDAKSSKS
ncbi:50S ribosomal protein L10 [Spirochaetota bacterium]|nr:50S ribosomal protein L10 [Spirochaetota bacterium]